MFLSQGMVSIVMEYMNGGSLQGMVESGGCRDEGTLASIAYQALEGLAFLHARHQIHRDIKPANLLRSLDGRVKLADFGIARQLADTWAQAKTFVGTLIYMAPERIESEAYSYPSDIWSLGLSLLTIAHGEFPYSTSGGYWSEFPRATPLFAGYSLTRVCVRVAQPCHVPLKTTRPPS